MIDNVRPLHAPPPRARFDVGSTIGRYRVERVLGEGGMGLILLGRHDELDMKVAIKTVRPELARDERAVARLLEEARAVASLRSDHIVRLFDVARLEDGSPYLVFELVEGPDLDRVLEAQGPRPVDEAVAMIVDVCLGLAEAHRRGIVHRDIKPENLLLEPLTDGTSRVKIADFGIAKRSVGRREMALTQRSGSVGSPWYMAPEQMINARDVDQRADIWSLGVVLHELLSRTVPFPGDSPAEVCARVMSMPPVGIREVRPDVPSALESVIVRCLQRDRGLRYPDVGELALELARIVPSTAARARSAAGRLGAVDVTLGRSLTSAPVLALDPDDADVPASSAAEEPISQVHRRAITLPEEPPVLPRRSRLPYVGAALLLVACAAAALFAVGRWPVRTIRAETVPPPVSPAAEPAVEEAPGPAEATVLTSGLPPASPLLVGAEPTPPQMLEPVIVEAPSSPRNTYRARGSSLNAPAPVTTEQAPPLHAGPAASITHVEQAAERLAADADATHVTEGVAAPEPEAATAAPTEHTGTPGAPEAVTAP